MDEPKTCIFSGSTEGLNTSMTIKLDGGRTVEVWISDEFADDATPKAVREAYLAKHPPEDSDEMKQFKALAAKLGITIPIPGQTIAEPPASLAPKAPKKAVQVIQESKISTPISQTPLMNPENRIISGRAADGRDISSAIKVNIADSSAAEAGAPRGQYAISTQSKPSIDLKEGEIAEIGQVPGRGGVPVAIPIRRVGKAGTTNIRVVDSGGDPAQMRRFKDMAKASMSDSGVNYGKNGYDSRTVRCPLCATKPNPNCKKCGGLGEIDIIKQY